MTLSAVVDLGRAVTGRALLRVAGRLVDAQDLAAGLVAGVGHRVAVTACRVAELDPDMLVEPDDAFARRVAGLAPLHVAQARKFDEIVAHLARERPADGRTR